MEIPDFGWGTEHQEFQVPTMADAVELPDRTVSNGFHFRLYMDWMDVLLYEIKFNAGTAYLSIYSADDFYWPERHCRITLWNCGRWCISWCPMYSSRIVNSRSGSRIRWPAWSRAIPSTTIRSSSDCTRLVLLPYIHMQLELVVRCVAPSICR